MNKKDPRSAKIFFFYTDGELIMTITFEEGIKKKQKVETQDAEVKKVPSITGEEGSSLK